MRSISLAQEIILPTPVARMTPRRFLRRVLYWAAVLAVSLVLVFLLLRFLEARDEPQLEPPAAALTAEQEQLTTFLNEAP